MTRDLLISCLPLLLAIIAGVIVLRLLVWLSGARLDWRRLVQLPGDQQGGVQSLAFVLTLPIFVIVLMFIVQLSQLTIAKVVVEYAAFAAARSAAVWIPARVNGSSEAENRISSLRYVGMLTGSDQQRYDRFAVEPGSPKFQRIHLAAAQACMAIAPSRDIGAATSHPGNAAAGAMERAYAAVAPGSAANLRIPQRIRNKLAYALENTNIEIEVHHKGSEPPLQATYEIPPDITEFSFNEIGFQDPIYVKLTHHFALLPGPARLLARRADAPIGSDPEASYGDGSAPTRMQKFGRVWVYTLTATARLSNEGEKPMLPYAQPDYGAAGTSIPDPVPEPSDSLSGSSILY